MDKDNNRGMRDWLIFIRTAETGSLTQASRILSISPAAVSKAINRFEMYLGVILFTRTTKGMNLTEAGHTALGHAREITSAFYSLLEEIRNPNKEIKGSIRFSAPAIICEFLANEWVDDYVRAHPQVKVFLDAREHTDLNRDSPELDDLVLRSGRIESEDLVQRQLSTLKLVLCASPDYLRQNPPINHPSDLENHRIFRMHNNGLAEAITIHNGNESYTIKDSSKGISSNNLFGMLNLVIQGRGISLATPGWLASSYTSQHQLEILLPDWTIPDLPVWLIWRQRPKQTSLFTDFRDYIEYRWNTRPQHGGLKPSECAGSVTSYSV